MRTRTAQPLVLSIALLCLVALCLALATLLKVMTDLVQVLVIISGTLTIASLVAIQRYLELLVSRKAASITIADLSITEYSLEGVEGLPRLQSQFRSELPPWEVTASGLVGVDNALALAKIRIDLERELRRLAFEADLDLPFRTSGILRIASELARHEIISSSLLAVLKGVNVACNQAIHGADISSDAALAVMRVGLELVERLRQAKGQHPPSEPLTPASAAG